MNPVTPQWLMSRFDSFVEDYREDSRELIYKSCKELLDYVHKYGLTNNSDQLYKFLCDQLRYLRENPYNEPEIQDFRNDLAQSLGI